MTIISSTIQLGDADALRRHLDTINERGEDDRCAGIDSAGQPFLAALTGPYATSVRVLCCDPDDVERDQGEYCDTCSQAVTRHGLDTLHYPVVVLQRAESGPTVTT